MPAHCRGLACHGNCPPLLGCATGAGGIGRICPGINAGTGGTAATTDGCATGPAGSLIHGATGRVTCIGKFTPPIIDAGTCGGTGFPGIPKFAITGGALTAAVSLPD